MADTTIQQEAIERWRTLNLKCRYCNKPIPYEKRKNLFCGYSCSNSYNNKGRVRNGKPQHECPICRVLTSNKQQCCSHTCFQELRYQKFIEEWLSGKVDGLRGADKVSSFIRRWLFEKYNNKCSKCGWSETNETTGKIPLEIEHIDGNWKNNEPHNLLLLCPNCHSLTSTYGVLNKGNGRRTRRGVA